MYLRKLPSGKWSAVYRDAAGKRHSESFPTKAMAKAWAAGQEELVRQRLHRDPKAGRLLFAEWERRWTAARVVEQATAAKNLTHMRLYVLPQWGTWPLDAITRMEVQGWVKQMQSAGVGAETIRSSHALFGSVLTAAVRSDIIPANPALGVDLPRSARREYRYLSRAEFERLHDTLPEPWATLVLLAVHTGMRWGELAGLHVHRLDLLRKRVTVVEVLTEVQGRFEVKAYPKSRKSQRTLPLTDRAVEALARHLEDHPREGLVFTGRDGAPLSRGKFRTRVWQPALARAGIVAPLPTPHDLRHTYASWLVQAGVDIRTVQERLGHESVVTTERYSHLAPDADSAVLLALADPPARSQPLG